MSETTKSLRPLVSRPACWESEHEAIITFFTDDGDVWGFPFFGLLAAQYTARNHTLALQWQGAKVRIHGPRARDFFTAFAKGSATGIKANGPVDADCSPEQLLVAGRRGAKKWSSLNPGCSRLPAKGAG